MSASVLRGRLLILLAAVLWSTSGLFAKAETFTDLPPDVRGPILAFWRALFAGLLLAPLVRRPRFRVALVPMTLCFAVMNVVFLSAMTYTTAANTIWLQHTAPLWVLLIGVTLLGERLVRQHMLLLGFGAAGVATILVCEFFWGRQAAVVPGRSGVGVALALASGLTYAGVVTFLRVLRSEDSAWLVVLNLLVTAAVILPYVIYLAASKGIHLSWMQIAVLAGFGLFQMGLPYVIFARGLRSVGSQEASGIVLTEPVLTPIWVLVAWGEHPSWWTYIGAALILTGLAIRYLWPAGATRDDEPVPELD